MIFGGVGHNPPPSPLPPPGVPLQRYHIWWYRIEPPYIWDALATLSFLDSLLLKTPELTKHDFWWYKTQYPLLGPQPVHPKGPPFLKQLQYPRMKKNNHFWIPNC